MSDMEVRQRKLAGIPTKEGSSHNYAEEEDDKVKKSFRHRDNKQDFSIVAILFAAAAFLRFRGISTPSEAVFDEVHFGEFAAQYIKRSFFFDVHPPLAKMLIAFVGWIFGFNGDYVFPDIGSEIPKDVPYTAMRGFGAFLGSMIIPLSYLTLRTAGHSRTAAIFTALTLCFENGLVTNNRLVMLDSYLLFFTALSIYFWLQSSRQRTFSQGWWCWLVLTGLALGCTVSTKWVGLFTIATIGLPMLINLWTTLGNIYIAKRTYAILFTAKIFCIFIIPVIVYVASFFVHFKILSHSGSGDSFMAFETQNELKGEDPIDTPLPITYGSVLTIRHLATRGGYLHSHYAYYPEGSNQQQVTLYPFKDQNNWWRILKANVNVTDELESSGDLLGNDNNTWLEYVRNGDFIRLEHVTTSPRKLHSHNFPAPVTETDYHYEVSGYGFPDFDGDSNDFWQVQIEPNNKKSPEAGDILQARHSKFRLYHRNMNCHLFSKEENLPDWGFNQQEVSCIEEGLKPKTLWMVDEQDNPLLPADVPIVHEDRPGFLSKLITLNKVMWDANKEMTEEHDYGSRPETWPVLHTSIPFWVSRPLQIVLLGNPLVFWGSTVSVFTYFILWSVFQILDKRGISYNFDGMRSTYEKTAGFFVIGWAFHYFPFFFMHRQLFLHHYMVSLYFAVLVMGVGVEFVTKRFPPQNRLVFCFVLMACIVFTYYVYSPITYGEKWSLAACQNARLSKAWEFSCSIYDESSFNKVKPNQARVNTVQNDMEDGIANILYEDANDNHDVDTKFASYSGGSPEPFDEDYLEDEEGPMDEPTEEPIYEEPGPEFVDGKEVYGEDDEDEDDWPKTIYGEDPNAEDDAEADPSPLKPKDIPATVHH
ncbi:Dolichyl-phosphate-mannose-protein mannosyltransferase-domain-containing protein [Mycotypha africana]|uniref:Dolichyl-phosphate-mannose-protein mannosyltransferase-domain-containing protein n=1 Tax=Mycotypha africana TaxID=64632 RepID=UPI002301F51B|nr:Dolichyl-phosphate-mannose-protein mannosyltransferase-domain-containing protein [Mycotypha africana]KAI8987798.1 Dolichyl-phosphate-mannose-protein mannosyltransferase-domain-containing protein [Mycotypha africana]